MTGTFDLSPEETENINLVRLENRFYRLHELIIKKYGEGWDRLTLGCQLVAAFVGFGSKEEWTAVKVFRMCSAIEKMHINVDDSYKFMSLFKLASIEDLYNPAKW